MLTRLTIKNFRAFRELEANDLGAINLFTGLNNAGKTSLLEGVFLLSGGGRPDLAVNPNVVRGFGGSEGLGAPVGLWKELFFNLDVDQRIEIAATHRSLGELTLKVEAGLPGPVATITPANGTEVGHSPNAAAAATNVSEERALSLSFQKGADDPQQGYIRLSGSGFEVTRPSAGAPFASTIRSSRGGNAQEDAVLLGRLRRQKRSEILLEALRVVEPRLQSVEDSTATEVPMIWGDVGLPELVPLPVMGEGMARLARIVLGVSAAKSGVLLIDEIENGLHHSVLANVWRVLEKAALQFGTQVFATTHSLECVHAAYEALSERNTFRLHRLEADGERNRCITYGRDALDGAVAHGLEVR